jgi:hypothetical protein
VNAEATQRCPAGRRHEKPAWLFSRFYPVALAQRRGELCTELTAEMRSPRAAIHAGEREHPAGTRAGQLDSQVAKDTGGSWTEPEFSFAVPGLKRP